MAEFFEWLALQEGREDPIGDLERDVRWDGPKIKTIEALRDHMLWRRAVPEAFRALKAALKEWENPPCQLYRHWDAHGALLYVGISLSALNRLGQHKINAHWFAQIARVTVVTFPSKKLARDAERVAIERERPRHNKRA